MSHVTHHVTHISESCPTSKLTLFLIVDESYVTHMSESCYTYECIMSHIGMRRAIPVVESCHMYECAMSHIRMRHITRIWMCYSTNMNAPFHKWWSHVTRMNAPCHTYQCAMSHTCMRRVTHINAPCRTCVHATSNIERSTSHIWILHVTCMYTGILKLEKWWHT